MHELQLERLDTVNLTNYMEWFDEDATNILFKESEALDLAMKGAQAWAGRLDGEIVAIAFFSLTVMNNGRIYFAVKPSMRRQGIGAKLMELVLSESSINNLSTVQVNIKPENVGGQKILRKTGFVLTGNTADGLLEFERL